MRKLSVLGWVLGVLLTACLPKSGTGGIEFRLRFPARTTQQIRPSAYRAASYDGTLSLTTVVVTLTQGGTIVDRVSANIADHSLTLSNLTPGRYDLEVEAKDGDTTRLTGNRSAILVEAGRLTDAGDIALLPNSPGALHLTSKPPALTNVAVLPLVGEKPAATGVRVNGADAVSVDDTTAFRTTVKLNEGSNTFSLAAFNAEGAEGPADSFTVVLDTKAPVIGSFQIANGLASVGTTSVALQLDAPGAAEMRICRRVDCSDAPAWISFATSSAYQLAATSGTQTLYAQVRDEAGNASAVASDSVDVQLVVIPALTVTSVSPREVTGGSVVSIAGSGFGAAQGANTVKLGGVALAVQSWSETAISVFLNDTLAPGAEDLVVSINGTDAPPVSLWLSPFLSGASALFGTVNTPITLGGGNFGAAATTGSAVLFGGAPATIVSWSSNQIQVTTPYEIPPGIIPMTVVAGGFMSNPVTFTSNRPWIDSRYPRNVTIGSIVTLNGRNFGLQNFIKVNGLNATISAWSDTAIDFYFPAGLPKGTLAVQVLASGSVPSNAVQISLRGNDTWMTLDDVPARMGVPLGVWTGTELLVWGGTRYAQNSAPGYAANRGSRYNPATDTWTSMSPVGAPNARGWGSAVWTGTEMIVWGGSSFTNFFENTGGRYNPQTDSWIATGTVNSVGRTGHKAVWTGSEMIVFSADYTNTGQRYNPQTETWTDISTGPGVPSDRSDYTAVWTGAEMIVFGGIGADNTIRGDGARYNPKTDTWTPLPAAGAPAARTNHAAVWTGREMIVWGGGGTTGLLNDGGVYDALTDQWRPVSTGANVASARSDHEAVWTGAEMLIFGGDGNQIGARYNPRTDTWAPMSATGAPADHETSVAVWTGHEALVWGGFNVVGWEIAYATGGRYDPGNDMWTPMSSSAAALPSERGDHSAVWTGSEMIVWGGYSGSLDNTYLNTGGRYNPVTANWLPTNSGVTAPTARRRHAGIWTGSQMLIWGGVDATSALSDGGLYDPGTDSWQPTSLSFVPPGRDYPGVVWTGTEMLVWGGVDAGAYFNGGARYDPVLQAWNATSTGLNVPSGRSSPSAVWTGSKMLIWGGYDGTDQNTGGAYDPAGDTWTSISTTNAPTARHGAYAIWDGTFMDVWGGSAGQTTGARYYPTGDVWSAMATAPTANASGTAVWTGSSAVVFGGLTGIEGSQDVNRYVPASNTWLTVSSSAFMPTARYSHTAVWTGTDVIIWGGFYDGERSAWQDGAMLQP